MIDAHPFGMRHDADVEQLGQRRKEFGHVAIFRRAYEVTLGEKEIVELRAHGAAGLRAHGAPLSNAGDSVGLVVIGKDINEISPTSYPRAQRTILGEDDATKPRGRACDRPRRGRPRW